MAAARDQTARVLREETDEREDKTGAQSTREVSGTHSLLADVAEENRRRGAEMPAPPTEKAPAATPDAAATSSKRKRFVLIGLVALLALAAVGYGVHYLLVGRFFVSTDDAYVRANNTMLGARVSGHIAAIILAGITDTARQSGARPRFQRRARADRWDLLQPTRQ